MNYGIDDFISNVLSGSNYYLIVFFLLSILGVIAEKILKKDITLKLKPMLMSVVFAFSVIPTLLLHMPFLMFTAFVSGAMLAFYIIKKWMTKRRILICVTKFTT